MSVRRWIVVTGVVVAVAGGAVGTGRVGSGSQFEARAFLQEAGQERRPAQLLDERERFLDSPAVRELVHSRLGATPPVWVKAAPDDTVVVRSRGATPERAAKAAETYATSYVDARRRQIKADVSAAAENVQRMTAQIKSQLETAEEPRRSTLVQSLGAFNTQLDRLQGGHYGPNVVDSGPGEPVHDWSWTALFVAGLGATVGVGAALSPGSTGRRAGAVV